MFFLLLEKYWYSKLLFQPHLKLQRSKKSLKVKKKKKEGFFHASQDQWVLIETEFQNILPQCFSLPKSERNVLKERITNFL